jgi:hypothetical protein
MRPSPLGTAATTGLVYQPRMSVEQKVEWELAGETEVLGENLPQCHFVHHKFHMTWPGLEPGPSEITKCQVINQWSSVQCTPRK